MSNMVKALVISPEGEASMQEVEADWRALQAVVGGPLEGVSVHGGTWHAYVDEEGKIKRLPLNIAGTMLARSLGWGIGDVLVGPVVFVGNGPGGQDADVPAKVLAVAEEMGMDVGGPPGT